MKYNRYTTRSPSNRNILRCQKIWVGLVCRVKL